MCRNKDDSRSAVSCPLSGKLYNKSMVTPSFYYILDIGVVNTYVLETKSPHCACRSQKEFCIEMAREVLAQHPSRKERSWSLVDSAPQMILAILWTTLPRSPPRHSELPLLLLEGQLKEKQALLQAMLPKGAHSSLLCFFVSTRSCSAQSILLNFEQLPYAWYFIGYYHTITA